MKRYLAKSAVGATAALALLLTGCGVAATGASAPSSSSSSDSINNSIGAGKTNAITDYGQDLFVGRIPVDASGPNPEAAALAEINSLHAYEDSPPASGSSTRRRSTRGSRG